MWESSWRLLFANTGGREADAPTVMSHGKEFLQAPSCLLQPPSCSTIHQPPSSSLSLLPPSASFMFHHPSASLVQPPFLQPPSSVLLPSCPIIQHPSARLTSCMVSIIQPPFLHPPSSILLHPASFIQPPSSSLPSASSPPPPGRIAEMTFPDVPRGHFLGTAPPNDPLLDTFPDTFPGRSPRFPGGSREVPLRSFAGPCTYH